MNWTDLMFGSRFRGMAKSTCSTFPKAEADVAEPPRVRGISVGAAPCAAKIVEHRASHAEQPERVPVGVDALLDVEQRTLVAALVVPGVAAQAGVASQQQLAG